MRIQKAVLFTVLAVWMISQPARPAAQVEVSAQRASPNDQATGAALETRISRVENGLLPSVVIKGAPPATMRLADRMRFYKVPGVSVAVINNGGIEWARGFGVKEIGKSGISAQAGRRHLSRKES